MEQNKTLMLSGLIGIIVFLILPGFLKIFSFLIPGLTLSWVFTKKFNWTLFLGLTLLYLFFPSSFFTLDASNPFNYAATVNYIENVVKILVTITTFVIPIIGLLAAVYALWIGNNTGAMKGIIQFIASVIIILVSLFFGSMLGWELFSLNTVKPIFLGLWSALKGIVNFFTQTIPSWFFDYDFSNLELKDDIELLSVIDSPATLSLTIASIYPLIISMICGVIGFVLYIMDYEVKIKDDQVDQRFNRPRTNDFSFLIFLIIVLIATFILYLTYSFETFMNYQNLGFFTIYILITSVSCIFLTLGIGSTTKNTKETIFGIIIGVALLFLYANMFVQQQTLDLLNLEYENITVIKIINQFLFVAPTESLLFHVFLPGLVLFYYLSKNKILSQDEIDLDIRNLNSQIEINTDIANAQKSVGDLKKYAQKIKEINKKKLKKIDLENKIPGVSSQKLTPENFVFYLVYCVGFNLLFSILHWFKSGLTFEIFWSSGLGFLYLSSGMILTLVSYRFGWISGILSHAIHNSTTLLLITLISA